MFFVNRCAIPAIKLKRISTGINEGRGRDSTTGILVSEVFFFERRYLYINFRLHLGHVTKELSVASLVASNDARQCGHRISLSVGSKESAIGSPAIEPPDL